FTLLLNAAGIPIFLATCGHLMPRSLPDVRKLGWTLAISAMVFVAAHQALEAARMAGEMNGVLDPAMQKMALESRAGAAFALRMVGLALVAIALGRYAARPANAARSTMAALLGTLLTIISFTLQGHTTTTPHRSAAALVVLHLL